MVDVDFLYDRKLPEHRLLQFPSDIDLDLIFAISLLWLSFCSLSDSEPGTDTLVLRIVLVLCVEAESII